MIEESYLFRTYSEVAALSDVELTRAALSDMAFQMAEKAEAARKGYTRRSYRPRLREAEMFDGLRDRLQTLAAAFPDIDLGGK